VKLNLSNISPSITNMIRMDHTHVLMLFRRFQPTTSLTRKKALVANACLALEIHAQLEEEIFYPALQAVIDGDAVLDKSKPEHDEMRALIAKLRAIEPGGREYDDIFRELMRTVLHHVADEESMLLPQAEEKLHDDLGRLGIEMTKRRMQLLKPHIGEVAATTAKSFPYTTVAAGLGGLALGLLLFTRPAPVRRKYGVAKRAYGMLKSAQDFSRSALRH
jgi:hemerythrin superfamily protein